MRVLTHAAIVAVLTSGWGVDPATAQPRTSAAPGESTVPSTVTLITGDKVTVARRGAGWDVRIQPVQRLGAPDSFLQHAGSDGVTVIPASVAPLIRSGQLDRALFDVTGLIRLGYDDAHTPELPLLVESRSDQARSSVTALGKVTRDLPAAKLTAVSTPKRDAAKVVQTAKTHKVWLNGKAVPMLDQSVPQVGAPGAWQQGQTGVGATIAVLDTGYDDAHPDLAGIVKGEKDFTGAGIRDVVGHGTHVASIAAGRGTASNGRYTGVAPGANLLVGKVCATFDCSFDAVLDGMQWAADSGAKVVNMSLGFDPGDGTGPLDTTVNRISAEKGVLFVIGAGNNPGSKVASPAAADAALAVGSVNKQDVPSWFSSPGPRSKDYVVKPDIAGPGEDIVAARAKGTLGGVVDEFYARSSGTSMATPHVAGGAAILAAQHPDWTGQQIKAALMGSAHPVANATIYQQGNGRLDVNRAVSQTVTATVGNLSLGLIRWPNSGSVLSKPLTYRNSGTAPVTLSLSSSDAALKVSATEVTVPAGGEATVTISFDGPQALPASYGGLVLARSGTTEVRTAVGATKEQESYDLTLRSIDRDGRVNGPSTIMVQNLDNLEISHLPAVGGDTIRVPAGRYAVLSQIFTPAAPVGATTHIAKPEFLVRSDMTVELDARLGIRVSTSIDQADARQYGTVSGHLIKIGDFTAGGLGPADNLYAVPTTGTYDHFMYFDNASYEQPLIKVTVTKPERFQPMVNWVPGSPRITDTRELSTVDVVRARPEDLAQRDVRGKVAVFTIRAGEQQEFIPRLKALRSAGATAVFFYLTDSGGAALTENPALPTMYGVDDSGPRLATLGTATVRVEGITASPYHYEISHPSHGAIPANLAHRARVKDLAEVRATYRAAGPQAEVFAVSGANGFQLAGPGGAAIPLPTSRVERYTSDTVSWQQSSFIDQRYVNTGDPRVYQRGSTYTTDWYKAVLGPGRAQLTRTGTRLAVDIPLFTDAGQHAGEVVSTDKGGTVLYANGKEIDRSERAGFGRFTVGDDPAKYRLTTEVTRDNPAWPLSTKLTAEWEFATARTGPLPTITFDPEVDNTNTTRGGTYAAIPVRPGKDGIVRTVDVSTDDGTFWRKAPLVQVHDRWWAVVVNPSDGFVSLRVQASYPDGSSVSHTVIRAYRVK